MPAGQDGHWEVFPAKGISRDDWGWRVLVCFNTGARPSDVQNRWPVWMCLRGQCGVRCDVVAMWQQRVQCIFPLLWHTLTLLTLVASSGRIPQNRKSGVLNQRRTGPRFADELPIQPDEGLWISGQSDTGTGTPTPAQLRQVPLRAVHLQGKSAALHQSDISQWPNSTSLSLLLYGQNVWELY